MLGKPPHSRVVFQFGHQLGTMDQTEFQNNYRIIVEKIFNNWQNLRLAVEHGMGGRNGHQIAIDIMDYTYQYCIGNDKITEGELQDVIEELMDQEFDTICEDGSVSEICRHLLRYKEMSLQSKYAEIETELSRLPQGNVWLRKDVKINYTPIDDSSEDEGSDESTDGDDGMDVDEPSSSSKRTSKTKQEDEFVEPEPGWTTVRSKRK
ncbi:pre-rRNA-processing protein TSR2 homolog [Stomoxys calcitrans]|uniref:Pre-rRNA-processing protein TSR2 homolog n=1 Tax=Stomoxys calcitrans TaxID=35570 RepID=A0A1I8P723_STOCA|nr:pre-rRNA-processing protein TSR2 homolog [Stomoxys calcitrans]